MKRLLLRTFLISLAVWAVFSWPLPLHVTRAIPSGTVAGVEHAPPRYMDPGDHLQLLYHFRLFADFLGGGTPWFHNLYEFNTGDDEARREPGSYYFPFSLFHAIGQAAAGPAFGWNLSGFLALWLTYLGTTLLVRRYTEDRFVAAACALLAITFPYRWINIAGGSPTGFGMMWVPWLLLGLDVAVRDSRVRGGALAAVSVLMASWGDTHVFYFGGLMIPCWCLFALLARESLPGRDVRAWGRLALAVAPVALGGLAAVWWSKLMTKGISATRAAEGRLWTEVALFSPHASGFLGRSTHGSDDHIFLGYTLLLLLVLLLASLFLAPRRRMLLALLLAGIAGICILALGTYGPKGGLPLFAVRKLIPQYVMIRQTAKIYCLLPTVLAVAAALGISRCRARWLRFAALALLLGTVIEFHQRFSARLCLLDREQGAYAAAAQVAPARPAALVLPLWPGDSHFSSIYQHYALNYRIRLINGYRPFVPASYIEQVFTPLESANQGLLDDAQLDLLTRMGVGAVLLHEDLFPEKVSPFPVGQTLRALLNNPRLTMLKQDGPVWAFQIHAAPVPRPPVATNWVCYFPARHYAGQGLRARGTNSLVTKPTLTIPHPDQRWMVHAQGPGALELLATADAGSAPTQTCELGGARAQWIDAALPAITGLQSNYLSILTRGGAAADYALLAAGSWPRLAVGESVVLPAPCFFHAGYTDLADDSVVFRAARDREGLLFYGPKLPLEPGRYRAEVDFSSPTTAGREIGLWIVTCPEGRELRQVPMRAGEKLSCAFDLDSDLPLLMILKYYGSSDVRLRTVTLTRDG